MRVLKCFVVTNTAISGLILFVCLMGAISGNHAALVLTSAFATNVLLGFLAYRSLVNQPKRQFAHHTHQESAKALDDTIIKGMIKKGFTQSQIAQLWHSGRMIVS